MVDKKTGWLTRSRNGEEKINASICAENSSGAAHSRFGGLGWCYHGLLCESLTDDVCSCFHA
jgi:hypothetical protein